LLMNKTFTEEAHERVLGGRLTKADEELADLIQISIFKQIIAV
jgi:hypothetical protein